MAPRFVDKFLTTRSINYVTVTMGIASEKELTQRPHDM